MFDLPKNISQKGAASLVVIALLLAGITAAVYLTQTGTSFLPQAASDKPSITDTIKLQSGVDETVYKIASDKRRNAVIVRRLAPGDKCSQDCSKDGKGCFNYATSSTEDFRCISIGSLSQNMNNSTPEVSTPWFTVLENTECNNICDSTSKCIARKLNATLDYSCASDDFIVTIPQRRLNNDTALLSKLVSPKSIPAGSWYSNPTSGNPDPAPGAPAQTNQPGVVGDCPANHQLTCPAGEACKIDHVNTRWCTANKPDGESCGAGCIYIGGLKKVIYPENTLVSPVDSYIDVCNTQDKGVCTDANNEECAIFVKNINGKDYKYSACRKKTSTSPAAPATQPQRPAAGAPAAAAPAAAQPQSAACAQIQDPWDIDKRGNSAKVEYVLKKAAEAAGAEATSQNTPLNAANAAKSAYVRAFNTAYISAQGFGVDIARAKDNGRCADNSATVLRDKEANNTSIHAYVLKKSPGIDWNKAKSDGLVQEAIRELRLTGISVNDVSTPGSQPTKLTIDPNVAVDCGTDLDGTKIPCYKMGVFASYDDLKATEAQATIASKRYELSQKILNEAKGKINDAILAAAQTKLDAAKAKAAACMPK